MEIKELNTEMSKDELIKKASEMITHYKSIAENIEQREGLCELELVKIRNELNTCRQKLQLAENSLNTINYNNRIIQDLDNGYIEKNEYVKKLHNFIEAKGLKDDCRKFIHGK